MKIYLLVSDVGEYSARDVNNLAAFRNREKAEEKMTELTTTPEVPDNWEELWEGEYQLSWDKRQEARVIGYENSKKALVEVKKGLTTLNAKLQKAIEENDVVKINDLTKQLSGFGKKVIKNYQIVIDAFEKDPDGLEMAMWFPTKEDWKQSKYRAEFREEELHIQEFDLIE